MKIKIQEKSYDEVLALPARKHQKPRHQNLFWRTLLRLVSVPDLAATHFSCKKINMERLGKKEPALFLMNHSSFIDLKSLLPFCIRAPLILSAPPTALSARSG
ncbi:MAG: hypothetical protein IKD28_04445 [Clostridia bacterium]|nr:hypothetical protein [Clostridia bacterium]